jgi:hypothetical protein
MMMKWNGVMHNGHKFFVLFAADELYHVAMHKTCA